MYVYVLLLSLLDITNWKEKIKYLEIKPHKMLVRDKEVFFFFNESPMYRKKVYQSNVILGFVFFFPKEFKGFKLTCT